MCGYYRRFIKYYSKKARPLTNLLHNDQPNPLPWTQNCEIAVKLLKHELSHAPVLIYPDFTKSFYIETDGSKNDIGAILS